ncbi:MBL fold metallo-hydrolase [Pseudoalteromonas mariniglutinosa]|uniref:MBL fold metallo-hydrolase n=1 Tax=Pseudoalteromonas mariniglutinosa TaxID=206042 RepID=UPI00384A9FBD
MNIITIPVTAFAQNCRIIICQQSNQAAIIDPGGDVNKLVEQITQLKVTLIAVYLTHGHLDHVAAAKALSELYMIDIIGPHQDDQFWFDALPLQAQMFGLETISPFYPTRWLQHNDSLELGGLCFEVKHCPGHTPGHVIFYERNTAKLIVGDVIFQGSIGRTDFPQGNSVQLLASIQSHILILDDSVEILPGHGSNTTVGIERKTNPFISGQFG